MSTLVIIEHDTQHIYNPCLRTISAAKAIGNPITALIFGHQVQAVVAAAKKIPAIDHIIVVDDARLAEQTAEIMAPAIIDLASDYEHILISTTTRGKNLLPRVAAALNVMQISAISAVIDPETFERGIYAGKLVATVRSQDAIKIITVQTTHFDPIDHDSHNEAAVETYTLPETTSPLIRILSTDILDRAEIALADADIVVAGGRGIGSADFFNNQLIPIAKALNAAIGASRAAVDAGFCPNTYQVGQTGKTIAPDLYFAIGISGAVQHQSGMKNSKVIVAINRDENAPIFDIADYALVGDINKVLPALLSILTDE